MQRRPNYDPEANTEIHRTKRERKEQTRKLARDHAPKTPAEFVTSILQQLLVPLLVAIILFIIMYSVVGLGKYL